MSTGFHFEGFLRSMQGDFMTLIGAAVFFLVIWLLIRAGIDRSEIDAGDRQNAKAMLNWVYRWIILIGLIFFFGHAISAGFTNRIPRSDVDGSSVYRQMDSHLHNPDHN